MTKVYIKFNNNIEEQLTEAVDKIYQARRNSGGMPSDFSLKDSYYNKLSELTEVASNVRYMSNLVRNSLRSYSRSVENVKTNVDNISFFELQKNSSVIK